MRQGLEPRCRIGRLPPGAGLRRHAGRTRSSAMWSEGRHGHHRRAAPGGPLSAPDGLDGGTHPTTSITLTWDSVRNAGSYEVQQRQPPDGNWGDADCGGDGNEVEDEECVVSGLASGTDYDFRVRAVPSDTDRYETSAWSDTEESPHHRDGPPAHRLLQRQAGMGDLNVRDGRAPRPSITLDLGSRYGRGRTLRLPRGSIGRRTRHCCENPCEGRDLDRQLVPTSQVIDSAQTSLTDNRHRRETGSSGALCVRTHERGRSARLSFAWAVSATATLLPTAGTAVTSFRDAHRR